jgi:hypothetical protein
MTNDVAKEKRWIHPCFKPLSMDTSGPFIQLSDGSLMIVEGNATRVSTDLGKSWSEPQLIYDGPGPGIPQNAGQLFRTTDGTIILVWRDARVLNWDDATGEPGDDGHGDVWAIRSLDEGRSWIDRQRIFQGICGHPPINAIQTKSGRTVVPIQFYMRNPGRNAICTYSSADNGATWKNSNIIDLGGHGHHDGAFEPTFVELEDSRLWMLIRTNWDRFWEAYSEDGGLSWRVIKPSSIEASTSPGYLTRLRSGRLVLIWNRLYPEGLADFTRRSGQLSEVEASWHREELSIAFSEDDGATWSQPIVIAREKDTWISYAYLYEPEPGMLWIFTGQGDLKVSIREADLVEIQ